MHLLIAAAGSGRRMGADRNKLLLPLLGRPVIAWTVDAALGAGQITWIGIVGQDTDRAEILDAVGPVKKPLVWIQGGGDPTGISAAGFSRTAGGGTPCADS